MNFLAHLWLADATATSRAGAVLGDFVKGPELDHLPPALATGVRLHRRIDGCSDRLPAMRVLRGEFDSGLRRYAGILLDLGFDHVLACEWAAWHPEPLSDFASAAQQALLQNRHHFPEPFRGRLDGFAALLCSYREPAGLARALQRTAARLSRPYDAEAASRRLQQLAPALRAELPHLLDEFSRLNLPRAARPGG